MKKLFAALVLSLMVTGVYAQTGSGTVVLSGSAGYSKTTQENESPEEVSQTTYSFLPGVGYFVQDGLELGVSFGYSHTAYNRVVSGSWSMNGYEVKNSTFSFSPYIRKYLMVTEKVGFTGRASAGYSTGNTENSLETGSRRKIEFSGFQVALVPGLSFFPTEKIGIHAAFGSFGYSKLTSKPKDGGNKTTNSTVGLNLNPSTLSIGFSYHFNRAVAE